MVVARYETASGAVSRYSKGFAAISFAVNKATLIEPPTFFEVGHGQRTDVITYGRLLPALAAPAQSGSLP